MACKKGHTDGRYPSGDCKACAKERAKLWSQENPERRAEIRRQWQRDNPLKRIEMQRSWRVANPGKATATELQRRRLRPEGHAESSRRWSANNPSKVRAFNALRRARVLNATPPWADLDQIAAVYAEADRLTTTVGVVHHVDHIVPLAGKNVCGLHVPWNLQAIPAVDNMRKGNRL